MTKREFIDGLCRKLRYTPVDEAQRTVSFYSEAIDDRMEDGMSEEEAVAAMGSLDDIAREIAPAADLDPQREQQTEAEDKPGERSYTFAAEGVKRVTVAETFNDVRFVSSEDGMLRVRCTEGNGVKYNFKEGSTLAITKSVSMKPASENKGILGLAMDFFNVGLKNDPAGPVIVELPREKTFDLSVNSASGDLSLELPQAGEVVLRSGSGDVEISSVSARSVSVNTASGDIEVRGVSAAKLDLKSASGDIELSAAVSGQLVAASVSGDIEAEITGGAERLSFVSTSGDIRAEIEGRPSDYQIKASVVSGDADVPEGSPTSARQLKLSSVSGDIRAEFTEE